LKKVYEFDPIPTGVKEQLILGGQGNLWTESVPQFRQAEYMLWPRSLALAEVLWSPKSSLNWKGFVERTEAHLVRLSQADINFSKSFYDAIIKPLKDEKGALLIQLDTELEGLDIYYTFDNTYPDHHSLLYKKGEKLSVPKDAESFGVITYRAGKPIGRIISVSLETLAKRVENE
jgi:hexosaminidase